PSARPPVSAAVLTRKSRRSVLMDNVMWPPRSRGSRGKMDRVAHAHVSPAAADVGDRGRDVRIARVPVLLEEPGGSHHHAALAITALRDLHLHPRALRRMSTLPPQALHH